MRFTKVLGATGLLTVALCTTASAQDIKPGDNLVVEGIPALSAELADRVRPIQKPAAPASLDGIQPIGRCLSELGSPIPIRSTWLIIRAGRESN